MKKEPFKVAVNGHYEFDLQPDEARNLDIIPNGDGTYHLLHNGHSYHIEVLASDYASRICTLRIEGAEYTVRIADYYERLVHQLGLTIGGAQKVNDVKAPMPGLVISVLVEPGQSVQKGDPLLILEAMKMENIIKATGEGVVKTVHTQKGQAVEKGHVLLEFE